MGVAVYRLVGIAFDSSLGSNGFLWSPVDAPIDGAGQRGRDIEGFNSLLMANDALSLVESVSALGPVDLGGLRPLDLGACEPANGAALLRECAFDPFPGMGKRGARSLKSSARKAVDRYGGSLPSSDADMLLFEPVCDWVLLRNCLSVCARILFFYSRPDGRQRVLEDAGFARGNIGLSAPVANMGQSASIDGYAEACSVYRLLAAAMVSGRSRGGAPFGFSRMGFAVREDGALCLEVAAGDHDQRRAAEEALLSFIGMFDPAPAAPSSLTVDEWGNIVEPDLSVPASLFRLLLNHQGYGVVTCPVCMRTKLMSRKGSESKYCSDACRIFELRSKEKKAPEGDSGPHGRR